MPLCVCLQGVYVAGINITGYQACYWNSHKGLQASTIVTVFKPSELLAEGVATKEGGFYAHMHTKTPSCPGRFCGCEATNFNVTLCEWQQFDCRSCRNCHNNNLSTFLQKTSIFSVSLQFYSFCQFANVQVCLIKSSTAIHTCSIPTNIHAFKLSKSLWKLIRKMFLNKEPLK